MNRGYLGYLGYELKEDCGADPNVHTCGLPDSQLILADIVVFIDHTENAIYLVVVHEQAQSFPFPCSQEKRSLINVESIPWPG